MKEWRKSFKKFLSCELPLQTAGIDPAVLPMAAARFAAAGGKNTVKAIAVPDLPSAEKLFAGLSLLVQFVPLTFEPVFFPETPKNKFSLLPDESMLARALEKMLHASGNLIFVGSAAAFLTPLPPPEKLARRLEICEGMEIELGELAAKLVGMDYDDESEVSLPGEFARRGGILDLYSPAEEYPCRIEFFGGTVDSVRRFDPVTQRSEGKIGNQYQIIPPRPGDEARRSGGNFDFFRFFEKQELQLAVFDPAAAGEHLRRFAGEETAKRWEDICGGETVFSINGPAAEAGEHAGIFPPFMHLSDFSGAEELSFGALETMRIMLSNILKYYMNRRYTIVVLAENRENIDHIKSWCEEEKFDFGKIAVAEGNLSGGFIIPEEKLLVLTEKEFFTVNAFERKSSAASVKKPGLAAGKPSETVAADDKFWNDIGEGDYAVHSAHGIGIYRGIRTVTANHMPREVIVLEFADSGMLHVPLLQSGQISRYLGAPGKVKLSTLGSSVWQNTRLKAQKSIRNYAADLLRLQAVRSAHPGIAFSANAPEERLFASAFAFEDTPDQSRAAVEINADMENPRPMDRLLCGDVGFGKTEIAMRAAFKAVNACFQVSLMAPTTVLVQQHYFSFKERFAEYPVNIECLSRLRSSAEQREVLQKLAEHKVDIVIGTQKLCSKQVKFANLGLLVIDEEQRFGVRHKEFLRASRMELDVLSMSATPIPRTMYLALAGARDLSTLLTPPAERLPVKTVIAPLDDGVVADAINAEISRGGQIYLLHNRVCSIEERTFALRKLMPFVRFGIAHGQLEDKELSHVMSDFLAGKIDCLVCSTIVESGLDVANANTIIIENADRFGLAELYQLRGRVGRWKHQAYAYLLLPGHQLLTGDARKRINAIRKCSQLGAGLQLAMRDLEIRGSGNILGAEQSGHLNAIGFELYCHLLKVEVAKLKGETPRFLPDVNLAVDFIAFSEKAGERQLAAAIPRQYIGDEKLRLGFYRKLAAADSEEALDDLGAELADRFGPLPVQLDNLLRICKVKLFVSMAGYTSLQAASDGVVFLRNGVSVYKQNGKLPRFSPLNTLELKLIHLLKIVRDCLTESR